MLDTPFIPIWKKQALLLTTEESMLVWHILTMYRNRRAPYLPQSKHNDLNPMVLSLVPRLDTYLQLSKCHQSLEAFLRQQHFELDKDESLLVLHALYEYSSRQRHEVSQNIISLIQKIHTCLGSIRQADQREMN